MSNHQSEIPWKFTVCSSCLSEVFYSLIQNLKVKCTLKLGRIVAHKNTQVFHMTSRKQTVQGECFMNERQPNSPERRDRSGWKRIGKDIRASSYFFTRRAADVVPEACFTSMTEDRHDELAAMDLSVIAVALTPAWLVWILTVMPVWLYFSFCCYLPARLFRNFTFN